MRDIANNKRKSCLYMLQIIEMLEQEAKIDDGINNREYQIIIRYLQKKYNEVKKEYLRILKENVNHDKD